MIGFLSFGSTFFKFPIWAYNCSARLNYATGLAPAIDGFSDYGAADLTGAAALGPPGGGGLGPAAPGALGLTPGGGGGGLRGGAPAVPPG